MINPLLSNAEQHSQGFLVDNQNMAGIFTEATPPTAVNQKKNIAIDYAAAFLVGAASPVFGSLGMLLYLNMSKGKK